MSVHTETSYGMLDGSINSFSPEWCNLSVYRQSLESSQQVLQGPGCDIRRTTGVNEKRRSRVETPSRVMMCRLPNDYPILLFFEE
jgi:hypothetical protein